MTASEQHRREVEKVLVPLRAMLDRSWAELRRLEQENRAYVKVQRHFDHMGYGR